MRENDAFRCPIRIDEKCIIANVYAVVRHIDATRRNDAVRLRLPPPPPVFVGVFVIHRERANAPGEDPMGTATDTPGTPCVCGPTAAARSCAWAQMCYRAQ